MSGAELPEIGLVEPILSWCERSRPAITGLIRATAPQPSLDVLPDLPSTGRGFPRPGAPAASCGSPRSCRTSTLPRTRSCSSGTMVMAHRSRGGPDSTTTGPAMLFWPRAGPRDHTLGPNHVCSISGRSRGNSSPAPCSPGDVALVVGARPRRMAACEPSVEGPQRTLRLCRLLSSVSRAANRWEAAWGRS